MFRYKFFAPNEGGSDSEKDSSKVSPDNKDEQDDNEDETPEDDEEDIENNDDSDDNDESDDEEDGEGIAKQYFTDPSSIRKELRADFKKMQGVFTRKMQAASQVIDQARAFSELVKDQEFLKWAEARRNAIMKGKTSSNNSREDDDTEDDDEDAPVTRKDLQRFFNSIQETERAKQTKIEYAREFKEFTDKNPGWEEYKQQMADILEDNPKLTFRQALKLAKEQDDDTDEEQERRERKRNANVGKPRDKAGSKGAEKEVKVDSIQAALKLAKKQLGLS